MEKGGKNKYVAYVGTYTHGSSIGIHIYDIDVNEGTLTERKVIPTNNSSYVRRSNNGKYLYSIIDEGVAVFAIQQDGDLKLVDKVGIDGMRGCYITADQKGKYLVVAGYHDGKVTLIGLNKDGTLRGVLDGVFHRGLGTVAERNFRPRVSCVQMTPDNRYLCAVDNGIDQIKIYQIMKEEKLKLVDTVRLARESGPRKLRFSPDGKYAYLLYDLANCVDVFSYTDSKQGPVFEKLQTLMTPSDNVDELHDFSTGMHMAPDGKHLFTSTAGDDTLAMFSIDQKTGLLNKEFSLPVSGEFPKDIALFPGGRYIACVNHESNSITTFAVNYEKKLITMKGKPVEVETPNCILITPEGV
ncbi:MAG: beta-propeller fold lactonase family protein [Eubacterium sp.]|nr:beta-propeller fold lactonase family protein [Eubacterium sp.]